MQMLTDLTYVQDMTIYEKLDSIAWFHNVNSPISNTQFR